MEIERALRQVRHYAMRQSRLERRLLPYERCRSSASPLVLFVHKNLSMMPEITIPGKAFEVYR